MERYSEYKDSGAQWLGKIPKHWDVIKAKYLWNEVFSFSENGSENLLSVSQYDGVTQAKNESRSESLKGYKKVVKDNLVINIMLAWMGGLGVSEYNGIVSPAYCVYGLKKAANPKFMHYLYKTPMYLAEFARHSTGVIPSRWRMYTDDFGQVLTLIPPIDEQDKIVSYLDKVTSKIDEAIAQQQKMIDLLNERKQIIINNAVTKGLNPDAPMKDSGIDWIGEIPEHWELKKLKYICKAFGRIGFRGYSTTDLVNEGEGSITLSPSNMVSGHMCYDSCTYLSWEKYEESPEIKIYNGDILFVKTGSTYGKSSLVEDLPMKATINPQLLVLKNISCSTEYLSYVLQGKSIKYQIETSVIGGTIPTISQSKILNYIITYPTIAEQVKIVAYIKDMILPIDNAIDIANRQITLLQERKQIIINDVVIGKVKVS